MAGKRPTVLLHVCCGPCSTTVLERLLPRYEVVLYFANCNLDTREEYNRRLEAARRVAAEHDLPLYAAEYDHDRWLRAVSGLEWEKEGGARCDVCFRYRLEQAAAEAKARGLDTFTTTLTISPHKDAAGVARAGRLGAMKHGVTYLEEDFKKRDGFRKSVARSRDLGLYRQSYCGCEFSRRDREVPRDRKRRPKTKP